MVIVALCSIMIMAACNVTGGKSNESTKSASSQVTEEKKSIKEEKVQQKTNPATVEVAN